MCREAFLEIPLQQKLFAYTSVYTDNHDYQLSALRKSQATASTSSSLSTVTARGARTAFGCNRDMANGI